MTKTALVTGAHGFVGRHVARRLDHMGYHVTGIGHGDWTASEASAWGLSTWRSADIDGEALVEHAGCPDLIAHCAGSGSVPYSLERPREDFRRTVEATLAVLDFARLHVPMAKIVLPSSAAVYGYADRLPISVGAPLSPVSPYGVHKKIAEDLARSYSSHFGVSVAIVRLFSVYGPGLRKQLLWDACRRINEGRMSFDGDGEETRDWLHIDDAAILLASAAEVATPACPTFNGGNGVAVAVGEVVRHLATGFGDQVPLFTGVIRQGDPRHFRADLTEAFELGWRPLRGLSDGLTGYIDWFKDHSG